MSDDIIDLRAFLERRSEVAAPTGTMALWGADGERSRFALPLWRVVNITRAERGIIFWRRASGDPTPRPFVVLDVARDPARLDVMAERADFGADGSTQLFDRGDQGVLVRLGVKDDREWGLLADGRVRPRELSPRDREDVLFLSGECAGLLFLRSFADEVE